MKNYFECCPRCGGPVLYDDGLGIRCGNEDDIASKNTIIMDFTDQADGIAKWNQEVERIKASVQAIKDLEGQQ